MLGQRFGAKSVMLAGLALMAGGGALTATGDAFLAVAIGRLVSGIGAVLLNIMLTKMVTDWFAGREIVTAMSLLIVSWPLGIALGLVAYAPLALAQGWKSVMAAGAAMALACLVLAALAYRDPPSPTAPQRAH